MLDAVAALMRQIARPGIIVHVANEEVAKPTIAAGFRHCVEDGATEVIAFPYMLSPGKHSTRDIPRLVAEAAAAFPDVGYRVTDAFGLHEKLAEVVLERTGVVTPAHT